MPGPRRGRHSGRDRDRGLGLLLSQALAGLPREADCAPVRRVRREHDVGAHEAAPVTVQTFLGKYPAYDSLFSVTRLQTRLWDALGRAINHNPAILLQTQDLPPVYEENSCFYLFTRDTLMRRRNRLGDRPMMFEIDQAQAWDIDEEIDFEIVNFLKSRTNEKK